MTQSLDPLPGLGLTAILVSGARATESARSDRLFDDPFAAAFVEAASAVSATIAQAVAQGSPDKGVNQARRDSVAVRTRFYDDYLLAATRSGCRQVVLLAAGLDARAFRLPWPEGVRLWEFDMPEVFAFKERVLADLGARPRCERTVVPADLRADWPHTLTDAGFDHTQPTAWLIEGLLMYLDEGERDLLLGSVGGRSSAGSQIALDHSPGFFSRPAITSTDDPSGDRAAARFAAIAAAASSDPSLTAPGEWLGGHGWHAKIEEPGAMLARYGRPVPAQLRPAAGAAHSWIATAERATEIAPLKPPAPREGYDSGEQDGYTNMKPKNTICLWFEKDAHEAARFYATTFPDSQVTAVHKAPGDYPSGKQGDVLTVEFTVVGIPCLGLNGGPAFRHTEAFSFQIATENQEETDRYWNAIVGNGGTESECGWCKDRWGLSWQITPRALTDALAAGGGEAKRAFEAMMKMKKIDVATIEAARRG